MRNFCSAKVPHNFSAKNVITMDFVTTVRHNESLTDVNALNNWALYGMCKDAKVTDNYHDVASIEFKIFISSFACIENLAVEYFKATIRLNVHVLILQ